ncbi:MAG: amidohydrolase family protein [Kofleriaceae bacterium]
MAPDPTDLPLRFATRNALAALPWFEVDHGQIVLSDRSIGPVIDTHTHYVLPTLSMHHLDMTSETPDSNLLLGACCAHHLDIRANQCFSPGELTALRRDLLVGGLTGKGKRPDHTAPNLARDMATMNVTHAVVLGIDMAIPNRHPTDTLRATAERDEATGYGSVHPRSPLAKLRFEEQLHLGARGIKLHPPNQLFRPDAWYAQRIYRWCGDAGIPVFFHAGPAGIEPKLGQYCAQMRFYERPLKEQPRTQFVFGHAGSLQHREAIALQRRYPNVWLEISGLSLGQLREVITEADTSRVVFGSDWPFYHPVLPLAKVLVATRDRPELRPAILHDNAARLLEATARPR